jgi:hypothetical protein
LQAAAEGGTLTDCLMKWKRRYDLPCWMYRYAAKKLRVTSIPFPVRAVPEAAPAEGRPVQLLGAAQTLAFGRREGRFCSTRTLVARIEPLLGAGCAGALQIFRSWSGTHADQYDGRIHNEVSVVRIACSTG